MTLQQLHQMNTTALFRIPLTQDQAKQLISDEYQKLVSQDGSKCHMTEEIENNISQVAKMLTEKSNKCGLLLCGFCGNGKTTLLRALKRVIYRIGAFGDLKLLRKAIISQKQGGRAIFLPDEKSLRIEKAYNLVTQEELIEKMKGEELIGIDDLGQEPTAVKSYGTTITPLVNLMETRCDEGKFMAITSNLTPKQISEKYGKRIRDRFNGRISVIRFRDKSFRR